jgi:hypothetical protein
MRNKFKIKISQEEGLRIIICESGILSDLTEPMDVQPTANGVPA